MSQTIDGVNINFTAAQGNLTDVGGSLNLQINQSVALSGDFDFQKTTSTDANGVATTTLTVGANNITAFLGTNYGSSNETGVKLTNGSLGLRCYDTEGTSTYAVDATGTAALELPGVSQLQASATLEVRSSTTTTTTTTPGTSTMDVQGDPVTVTGDGETINAKIVNQATFSFTAASEGDQASNYTASIMLPDNTSIQVGSLGVIGADGVTTGLIVPDPAGGFDVMIDDPDAAPIRPSALP